MGMRRVGADRKLTPDRERELAADYVGGQSKLREIQAKFGVSKVTIYAILDRLGVPRTNEKPRSETAGTTTTGVNSEGDLPQDTAPTT
jgi:transposase